MPPSESGGSGGTETHVVETLRSLKEQLARPAQGTFTNAGATGVSRSDQDGPELAEKQGRRTSIRRPSQRGYCVIVPDTVAGAFACSTARSRA